MNFTPGEIQFVNIKKQFGSVVVIPDLTLTVKAGERLVLLGPSGCGKTTALRMIAGLETISAGKLHLGGQLANDLEPGERQVAMVFQNYALYPHMSIRDNIAFGLETKKVPAAEIERRIAVALEMLNLSGLEARKPRELSGGQRQRVALARAVVKQAPYFLLDEPLSNLDAQLRARARKELVKLHDVIRSTMVYVTHDQVEAMTIGQRIAVMSQGVLQQIGSPADIYDRPANTFVARFIGSPPMNLLPARVTGTELRLGDSSVPLPENWTNRLAGYRDKTVELGIRPEYVTLYRREDCHAAAVTAPITFREHFGNQSIVYFPIDGREIAAVVNPGEAPATGEELVWCLDWEHVRLFDSESGLAIVPAAG